LGALKITMQKFYRVNGESTQRRGVRPDVVLPSLLNYADVGESSLERALKFDTVPPTEHEYFPYVTQTLTGQLRSLSEARRQKNEDFIKLQQRIDRFVQRKNRKEVSLQEAKLRADLKIDDEGDAAGESGEDEEEKPSAGPPPVFDTDYFYNQEVLSITEDYLRLSHELGLGAVQRKAG
jgi:carboxyl-terminal processing protease